MSHRIKKIAKRCDITFFNGLFKIKPYLPRRPAPPPLLEPPPPRPIPLLRPLILLPPLKDERELLGLLGLIPAPVLRVVRGGRDGLEVGMKTTGFLLFPFEDALIINSTTIMRVIIITIFKIFLKLSAAAV